MATHFPKGKPALSPEALSIWAKTAFYGRTDDDSYLQLWQHLEDTGEVALHVWDDFVSDNIEVLSMTLQICTKWISRFLWHLI